MKDLMLTIIYVMTIIGYPIAVVLGISFIYTKVLAKTDEAQIASKRKELLDIQIKKSEIQSHTIDKESYLVYKAEFDKMIDIYTDTVLDEKFSVKMSTKMSMSVDITSEDMKEILAEVWKRITEDMSESMKFHLYYHLGGRYIARYTKFRATQIALDLARDRRLEVKASGIA